LVRWILILCSVLLLTACASVNANDDDDAAVAASPTTTPRPPGEPATWDDGSRVTFYRLERNLTFEGKGTDPRKEYLAVDVEHCAGSAMPTDAHVVVNSLFWQVATTNNRWYGSLSEGLEPALSLAELGAGECVRGWVTFQVPAGSPLRHLVYAGYSFDDSVQRARWDLSASS
jgi:hypothetical protein